MCGIAGSFGRKLHINQKDILNLNKALMHRGPDYQNYVREKQIFFYHARLSIIDIRNISHQPMYSSDKSLLIVFNGEIYNYIELKNKLSVLSDFSSENIIAFSSLLKVGQRMSRQIKWGLLILYI